MTQGWVLAAGAEPGDQMTVTQLNQIHHQQATNEFRTELTGTVCWVSPEGGLIVLQDSSGVAPVRVDPPASSVRPGQRIVLTGNVVGSAYGASLRIAGAFLQIDPARGMRVRSQTVKLSKGRHPITVSCFDKRDLYGLGVFFEGPGVFRQRIPSSALSHDVVAGGVTNWQPGLEYRVFEGEWSNLPGFTRMTGVKSGFVSNFDPRVRTRPGNIGIEFSGYLELPAEGSYTFFLTPFADDIPCLRHCKIQVVDESAPTSPPRMSLGQSFSRGDETVWSQVEGTVAFCSRDELGGMRLQLRSGTGQIETSVAQAAAIDPRLLVGSRIRLTGICQGAYTLDKQIVPGSFWSPSPDLIEVLETPQRIWTEQKISLIKELLATDAATPGEVVRVEGKIDSVGPGRSVAVKDESGRIEVALAQWPSVIAEDQVEVVAQCFRQGTNVSLEHGLLRKISPAADGASQLPVLTSVAQIKRLSRAEALREYPIQIRGVITWSEQSAVVLQDASGGVFVDELPSDFAYRRRVGEYWEIIGTSTARFSPMVLSKQATRIGPGVLPEPVRASGDQLRNGSLDTEYVEIQGAVLSIHGNTMNLLTHDGQIAVEVFDLFPGDLSRYEGAVIRLRGCLWAVKDEVTHRFKVSEVQMHTASISVDQVALDDPFIAPAKRIQDLFLYDAQARAFQLTRIPGQIIHVRAGEYFLMDGNKGLRFTLKTGDQLQVGDNVEVVGYPDLAGISPVLREAVARKTGNGPLPQAMPIADETALTGEHDSTLVRIRARLVSLSQDTDQVLTMQSGSHFFEARLNRLYASALNLRVGSLLELTGVFDARGGNPAAGQGADSFQLLLNSPAAIRVLSQPSWWTLQRVVVVVVALCMILALSVAWIAALRRQVEQRTAQLKIEIQGRQEAEFKRAIEGERSRIARDLHDDLGATVTEITMLADAGSGRPHTLERAVERFRTIAEKAREMVGGLDTIVWLVNPKKDFLPNFGSYLGGFAEECCAKSGITCRLKISTDLPARQMNTDVRHNLFLATKEALTNVVRHAGASEVELVVAMHGEELQIIISDNGHGFDVARACDGNGLPNLKGRLENIGGRCEIHSQPGVGTRVSLFLPLPA